MKGNDEFTKNFKSPIPPHLSPEEREEWEEEFRRDREELEKRKKKGLYKQQPRKRRGKLTERIANLFRAT